MSFVIGNEYDGDKTYEDGKQYIDDDKLPVRFEVRAVKNEYRSRTEGRPIFEDCEYIQIVIPGSREIMTYPIDENYKRRFKKRYEDWKANSTAQTVNGTLLAELSRMSKIPIAELNHSNVFTVEQLANLSDVNATQFMGNFGLRERAKNYLAAAAGEAPMLKLQAELEQRDNRIEVLQNQIKEMQASIAEMQKRK